MAESEARPRLSYTLKLFADYSQLYLRDEEEADDPSADWGDQLVAHRVAVAPGIVGIGTARNTMVPVRVDLFDIRPGNDSTNWDHVAEASLHVPSGRIVIVGALDYVLDAKRLPVTPGWYRVRACSGGLGSISANGLEGDDHYEIAIWPEASRPPEVLKRWLPVQLEYTERGSPMLRLPQEFELVTTFLLADV